MGCKAIETLRSPSIALTTNVLIVLLKCFAFLVTHAGVTFVEMLRSVSDLLNSVVVYVGEILSRRKDPLRYPLGRGRIVYLFAFVSSSMILGAIAMLSFVKGIQTLVSPRPIENTKLGMMLLCVPLGLDSLTLYYVAKDLRDKCREDPLVKTLFIENFVDVVSESIALITLMIATEVRIVDGVSSLVLSSLLLVYVFSIAKRSAEALIGVADPSLLLRIVKIALSIPGVVDVDDVKVIELAPGKTMVLLVIEVCNGLDMDEAQSIMNELRDTILRYVPRVSEVIVEVRKSDGVLTHPELFRMARRR